VAVTVISYITKDVTQQGLLCIPAIVGQLSQIFIGSFVAGKLAEAVEKNDEQAKTTSGKTA
jgi:sodium/bile acid cotransporter 7